MPVEQVGYLVTFTAHDILREGVAPVAKSQDDGWQARMHRDKQPSSEICTTQANKHTSTLTHDQQMYTSSASGKPDFTRQSILHLLVTPYLLCRSSMA